MLKIGVVGATGLVGQEILRLLDALAGPPMHLMPIASVRSAGVDLNRTLNLNQTIGLVHAADEVDWSALDVAFFSAGAAISRVMAHRAADAGCLVIDNTSAFRATPGTPLVVPEVNGELLRERPATNIVANPNCSTIQLVRVLAPLHRAVGLRRVVVSTYQAASGGGSRGLAELADRSAKALRGEVEPWAAGSGKFGPPLTFNLIPHIGRLDEHGNTHEERKIRQESRVILCAPELDVSATAVRVPVFHCHSEAVWLDLNRAVDRTEVTQLLSHETGIRVYDETLNLPYPMPIEVYRSAEDRARVHVGRIRSDPDRRETMMLWIVADNIWVGAALNAVMILSVILGAEWLGTG